MNSNDFMGIRARVKHGLGFLGWVGLLILPLLIVLLYAPAAGNDFVMFDDDINIYNNPMLGEVTWERVSWAFADGFYMPRYMPLGWISLMVIFEMCGLAPSAYHWANIALHAANTALVFIVVRQGLSLVARARGMATGHGWVMGLAWGAAFFWAVHPLRVEPVSWATGLHYVHATFWALLAVGLTWARLERSCAVRRWYLAGACAAYLCSVLVYPVTLGLPAALWLFEAWLRSRKGAQDGGPGWDWNWELAPFFVISALALAANVAVRHWVPSFFPPAPGLEVFSLGQRGLQAAYSAVYYTLRPLVAGDPTPVYGALFVDGHFGAVTWVCAILVGILLVGLVIWWRRMRGFTAWCLAMAAVGVPYYGLLESPFQTSDRYTYFPSVVLAFGIAVLAAIVVSGRGRTIFAGLGVAWLVWLAAAVPGALPVWRDDRALFTHVGRHLMPHEVAYLYLGRVAVKQVCLGDEEGARATMVALAQAGASRGVRAQIEEELAPLFERARARSKIPPARGWVAPDAQTSQIYAMRAVRAGEDRTARVRFSRALEIDPGFNEARYNFGLWLALRGEPEAAWAQYGELTARMPSGFDSGLERALVEVIARAAKLTGARDIFQASTDRLQAMGAAGEGRSL